ncbi:DUF3073 domain-containing protein [Rothia nasimurium]|uniref:DUF3073 domain-containing protein n=1 Tax=Rothia nasimurium TaxID=85336 RepID=UPI001F46CC4A|nr:DUF3073 domain-containing protein [Rothia nasimurium]
MGRGRQKAKATRQAREMKYFSPDTDYTALERELSKSTSSQPKASGYQYDDEDDYAEYVDKYADDYQEK